MIKAQLALGVNWRVSLPILQSLLLVGFVLLPMRAAADEALNKADIAAQVMALLTTDAIVQTAQNEIWPDIEGQIRAQNPDVTDVLMQTLQTTFESEMNAVFGAVAAQFGDVYVDAFTMSELVALKAFYSSEAGQKIIRLQPQIGLEVVPAMMQHMDQAVPEAMRRFFDYAQSRGVVVGELQDG